MFFSRRRDQSGGDSASDRKHRPMLAANFSLNGMLEIKFLYSVTAVPDGKHIWV